LYKIEDPDLALFSKYYLYAIKLTVIFPEDEGMTAAVPITPQRFFGLFLKLQKLRH
jgi:hypothetical protein